MKENQSRNRLSKNLLLTLAIAALCLGLYIMPPLYNSPYMQSIERYRARVIEVDNSMVQQYGIVKSGSQALKVEILEGPYKGQVVDGGNDLLGKMETDKIFAPGHVALLVVESAGGEVIQATAYDHYRLDIELALIILFGLVLIGFAGWGGARALLSFLFAILIIWKILLPMMLMGRDPIWASLLAVTVIGGVTLYLVAGVNRVALTAFLGSLLGILLTILLSVILMPYFKLHGAVQPYAETLLYTGFDTLNLNHLFIAAIFIGASGAVIDVAIDVATAMGEVIEKRPDLTRGELIKSGFAVGRNMTSTMITTLLMAYLSSFVALLMIFQAQGVPLPNILNTNYLSAEILRTVVGSFGIVAVAPFTALVGGVIFTRVTPGQEPAIVSE